MIRKSSFIPGRFFYQGNGNPCFRNYHPTAHLHILNPVPENNPDIFSAGLKIKSFIDHIPLPEKTVCRLGHIELGVAEPEQYRETILNLISKHISQAKAILGPGGKVTVSGLANPVTIRQADDRNIELFIDYSLTIASDVK